MRLFLEQIIVEVVEIFTVFKADIQARRILIKLTNKIIENCQGKQYNLHQFLPIAGIFEFILKLSTYQGTIRGHAFMTSKKNGQFCEPLSTPTAIRKNKQ